MRSAIRGKGTVNSRVRRARLPQERRSSRGEGRSMPVSGRSVTALARGREARAVAIVPVLGVRVQK